MKRTRAEFLSLALVLVLTAIILSATRCCTFAFSSLPGVHRRQSSTLSLSGHSMGSSSSDKNKKWKLNNDFPQFLNQCTVQTFLIVLRSLRDPVTIRWVDNFTAPIFDDNIRLNVRLTGTTEATNAITSDAKVANPNGDGVKLLMYHGLHVMNTTLYPTWDSYFSALLEQPSESFLVESYNGLSKDYEVEINPASLCTRLISVREQIAAEFANDLGIIHNMGYHIMDSYWEYMDSQKKINQDDYNNEAEQKPAAAELGAGGNIDTNGFDGNLKSEVTMSSGADGAPRILPPHNLVFLSYALDPVNGYTPSPLRKGNFDLLVLLATQESIIRILNNAQQEKLAGDQQRMYQKYLSDFYAERILSHFSGIQRYGRADDFLEELLFSSPRMSTGDGFSALVDPIRLTEMILDERMQVALEWQAMSKDVPNDHITIKRLQLDKLMESYQ